MFEYLEVRFGEYYLIPE
jgi:hypothetical protein